jgi:hypothetical protein
MINKTTNELQVFDDFVIDRSLLKHKSKEKKSGNWTTFTVGADGSMEGEPTRFIGEGVGDSSVNPPRDFNIAGIIEGDPHYWDGVSYEIKSELQRQQLISNLELREDYRRGGVRFAPLTKLYLWAFTKKYKNKPTRSIESFFVSIKHTKEQLEKIDERIESYRVLVQNAIDLGQNALEEKLLNEIELIGYESQLYGLGYTKVVTEEQLVKFVKQTKRGLRLDWIKNFTRVIPDSVLKKKKELDTHKIFDNFLILHYDPDNKGSAKTKKEKEDEKDPILFGAINGSRKLYFVDDWIDSTCDLQFKDIAKQLGIGEMRKSEITNKVKV